MEAATVAHVVETVFRNNLIGDHLTIVWHAGEPLAVPLLFYKEAFRAIEALKLDVNVVHHFQTNGMLIDDAWCEFIKEYDIRVGLSIDGPAELHDLHRKDRRGHGTHSTAMKGLRTLRDNDIPFHIIAVITHDSLSRVDEIFEFFLATGAYQVGFNIEEREGIHTTSSLSKDGTDDRVLLFWKRLHERYQKSESELRIREFERAYQALAVAPVDRRARYVNHNTQVQPLSIISIDFNGNISTFSPELLGAKSFEFGDFIFGNIHTGDVRSILSLEKFKAVAAQIESGIRECEKVCEYFMLCGGGAPSNKHGEHNTFAAAETMYCRHTIKAPLDVVLADLESALRLPQAARTVTRAVKNLNSPFSILR